MNRKVSKEICAWIKELGVSHVFMVPGILVEHLAWEMASDENLSVIIACHELGAGFMADGYARASGNPGVCLSIGGPGASNLLPSAMISRVDNVPVLYITGDVPRPLKNYLCFQDTGITGSRDREIFQKLIDFSVEIDHPDMLRSSLESVARRLYTRLPAHLMVSYDLQVSEAPTEISPGNPNTIINQPTNVDDDQYRQASHAILDHIEHAERPVILAGHRLSGTTGAIALKRFAETFGIPVATTYRAKALLPEDHPLSLGVFGYAGTKQSLHALLGNDCDLLLIMGASLNQRNTFLFDERLMPVNRKVVFLDTHDLMNYPGHAAISQFRIHDIAALLEYSIASWNGNVRPGHLINNRSFMSDQETCSTTYEGFVSLDWALRYTRNFFPSDSMFFVDSGAHRVYAGVSWKVNESGTFFTSDHMAPMGWAICAAIGARLARPGSRALVLTGDGCMRMHAMEIATAARYSIPVIYLVSNNSAYQSPFQRASGQAVKDKIGSLPLINWADFARSIGAEGCVVDSPEKLEIALQNAMVSSKPYIIDLRTHPGEPFPETITLPGSAWPDIKRFS